MTRMEVAVTTHDPAPTHKCASLARRALAACLLLVGASMLAACTPHQVSQVQPCAVSSSRGAPQLPKIGLTADELKEQAKCG
jgi:hypothetical protein